MKQNLEREYSGNDWIIKQGPCFKKKTETTSYQLKKKYNFNCFL
jgi:hypothetical protein